MFQSIKSSPQIRPIPDLHSKKSAFDETLLPDLKLKVVDSQTFVWKIADWNALKTEKKTHSPEFLCGGFRWRILLFPNGNSNADCISAFLESMDASSQEKESRWHVCAQFAIAVQHPSDPLVYKYQSAIHRFTPTEIDWGFNQFVKLSLLTLGKEEFDKPILENESVNLIAVVKVIFDDTGVLWHNFENYNSKLETGFVGLKNQGATCYMNSVIQSLYFTNALRKATFQIPTENENPDNSISLALQRIFYSLQTSDEMADTIELTKSFGWDTTDSFMQHDVQEFSRVLQDALEKKMKGTPAEGAISNIFRGRTKSFLKCVNIDFESSRIEDIFDIQLNVKGCLNLYDSFKVYCALEILDGDNMYQAEGHGYQVAKKGVIFTELPKVFHMQLKRFEYDFERDMNVKINDRFEYPQEIDLKEFLEENNGQCTKFILHGVLVHTGDVHGGHYCAFIKPSIDSRWFKFDDDRVVPVTLNEVLEDNFGVDPVMDKIDRYKKMTNAYMLVYMREDQRQTILDPKVDAPLHLRQRFEAERSLAIQKQKEKEQEHLYLRIKFVFDSDIARHDGFDLQQFDLSLNNPSNSPPNIPEHSVPQNILELRLLRTLTFRELELQLSQKCSLPVQHFRLWPFSERQNQSIRPDAPIKDSDKSKSLEDVFAAYMKQLSQMRLYVEVADEFGPYAGPLLSESYDVKDPNLMLFIKYLNYETNRLEYLGKVTVKAKSMKPNDLFGYINDRTQSSTTTSWKVCEEISPHLIDPIKCKSSFASLEVSSGDILCFQKELSPDESKKLSEFCFKDVPQYFDYVHNRLPVTFKQTNQSQYPAEVTLLVSKKFSCERVAKILADAISLPDPTKIKLISNTYKTTKKSCIFQELLGYPRFNKPNFVLYEVMNVSLAELESKRLIKGYFLNASLHEKATDEFLVSKNCKIEEVTAKIIHDFPEAKSVLRNAIYARSSRRISKILLPDDVLSSLADPSDIVIQEIMGDQPSDSVLAPVFHINGDVHRTHGHPFLFAIVNGEELKLSLLRLQKLVGYSDREWSKVKLLLAADKKLQWMDPERVAKLSDLNWSKGYELALDHPEKSNSKFSLHEKAIKIMGS